MAKEIRLTVFIACVATIGSNDTPSAQVRQCSAAPPANQHGHWSYRLIDGRKCWYEGKNRLSKSSLEWSAQAPAPAGFDGEPAPEPGDKRGNPLDAKAWAEDDFDTFEVRWRAIDRSILDRWLRRE